MASGKIIRVCPFEDSPTLKSDRDNVTDYIADIWRWRKYGFSSEPGQKGDWRSMVVGWNWSSMNR